MQCTPKALPAESNNFLKLYKHAANMLRIKTVQLYTTHMYLQVFIYHARKVQQTLKKHNFFFFNVEIVALADIAFKNMKNDFLGSIKIAKQQKSGFCSRSVTCSHVLVYNFRFLQL